MDDRSTDSPASPQLAAPTAPGERHEIIDIVRGFALFGVLLSNMVWTTQHFALTFEQRAALPTAALDDVAGGFVLGLVSYKFYTLFSMLFGLGFAVQLTRATQRGVRVGPTYARRLGILFVMGALHGLLLWFGDILHMYALIGFVLLLFARRSDRVVLGWTVAIAVLVLAMPFLQWLTLPTGVVDDGAAGEAAVAASEEPGEGGGDVDNESGESDDDGDGDEDAARFAALSGDDWGDVVETNWVFNRDSYILSFVPDENVHWYLNVLWKFLLGFLIGRRFLLQRAEEHLGLFQRVLPWALVVGLVGNVFFVVSLEVFGVWIPEAESAWILAWIPIEISIFALAMAYLCGLVLLHQRPGWRRALGKLAPVGRMALTNYLAHSVLFVVLFYGVGLGLLGEVGIVVCVLLSLAIFGAQMVFSAWWLKRFRFGPAEWAWRSLTYGRRQPFRAAPRAAE